MSEHVYEPGKTLIDRYVVEGYMAEGGMQEVYVAKDHTLDRIVVLKVPKNQSAAKRFKRSAIASARVNHANVARTLDYFEHGGIGHLIEEYIRGENLSVCLTTRYGKFDPHLVAHVLHHLAKGLAASHHAGVFHRDLKPSNIVVSSEPSIAVIKITDFGIARLAEEEIAVGFKDGDASITGSKTVVGALPYMAPEMIESPKHADKPADVWAVGAIVHQLLTGNPPYGSGLAAVKRIVDDPPPEIPKDVEFHRIQFRPLIEELWNIMTSCLRKVPAERPTADELVGLCSALCYSVEDREEGMIRRYGGFVGGWGFILGEDGSDVFFHVDSFFGGTPYVGQRVSYAVYPGSPNGRAFPITPLVDVVPL